MKKLAAISLLSLLLFNLVGYRLLFAYTLQQWDARITASLDRETYNENDLITLKVPLSLPYQTDWKEYERVDGEITISGQLYKYVKRKVVHGELVLLCLPDPHKTNLETAKDEFFKQANNLQSSSPAKKTATAAFASFSDIAYEYDNQRYDWLLHMAANDILPSYGITTEQLLHRSLTTPEQPPDAANA